MGPARWDRPDGADQRHHWDLTKLPARLLVLGGGSVGCELGQAFARLGSVVTIVKTAPRLLPNEEADAADLLTRALRGDGIDVRTGHSVTASPPPRPS